MDSGHCWTVDTDGQWTLLDSDDGMLCCAVVYEGRDVKCPDAQEILYTIKERQYFEHIDKAYNYASQLLLDLLMHEKDLMARLRFVARCFFVDFTQCVTLWIITVLKLWTVTGHTSK